MTELAGPVIGVLALVVSVFAIMWLFHDDGDE